MEFLFNEKNVEVILINYKLPLKNRIDILYFFLKTKISKVYILRPKNFLANLIKKAIYNLFDIVSFAIEEPQNIWIKRNKNYFNINSQFVSSNLNAPFGHFPQNEKYYFALYGLGSIFFFNNLSILFILIISVPIPKIFILFVYNSFEFFN